MKYTVALKHSDEGVAVWVPGLPGCASQGDTEQEALENIVDAIQLYLEVCAENVAGFETRVVEVAEVGV